MPKKTVLLAQTTRAARQKQARRMRVTVYYGYGLFVITLLALGASLVPWFRATPAIIFQNVNISLLLVSFLFTALAPPLVGYLSGDAATRASSKLVHHYNGVLFGALGVWLWMGAYILEVLVNWTFVPDNDLEYSLLTIFPPAFAAITTIILGVFYARSTHHQRPVIDYAPYRWTLIAAAAAFIASFGVVALSSIQFHGDTAMTFLIALIDPLLILLLVTLLGFWLVGKKVGTEFERIIYSLVAAAFTVMVVMAAGRMTVEVIPWDGFMILPGLGIICIVWGSYLLWLRRVSR